MNYMQNRKQHGATMGIIIVCCVILIILIIGLFHVTMLLGGSQELRNSVDAGTLNLGMQAVQFKTTPQGSTEMQFSDVEDKKGEFGLTNINRVLGKAFLMNANAAAMDSGGMGSGDATQHAKDAADSAQAICDRITQQLKDFGKTSKYFDDFIKVNSLKMYGKVGAHAVDTDWGTACLDRDQESNLKMDNQQIPSGYSLPGGSTVTVHEKDGKDYNYLRGYRGISVNSRQSTFVPFKYDEKPHLINGFYFAAQQKLAVNGWNAPVPNALSTKGETDKMGQLISAANAYVVTNPQHTYFLSMPHSYVHIRLEENEVDFKYQGLVTEHTAHYGYYPGQTEYWESAAGSGTFNITANLGYQYAVPTLYTAINSLVKLGGTNDTIMNAILQRVQEIKHDYTMSQLKADLMSCPTLGVDSGDFYIFPTYSTPDCTDPTIHVAMDSIAKGMAPWLNTAIAMNGGSDDPDGSEKERFDSEDRDFIPYAPTPNWAIVTLTGPGCKPGPYGMSEKGDLNWQPGTGYGGCLGKLTVKRRTNVYYWGVCTVL